MFMPPGFYNIENLSSQSPEIIEDLRRFEPKITVAKLAALLVRQEFHPNTLRLETLIHMAARYCEGRQPPKRKDMARWLNEHMGGSFAQLEDPVEDVFVSNICYEWGNARTFEGIWESADFHLQSLLDFIAGLPRKEHSDAELWTPINSLLRLSELIADRAKAKRYTLSSGRAKEEIDLPSDSQLRWQYQWVTFTSNDLLNNGIKREDLAPFIFPWIGKDILSTEEIGNTTLERYPLVEWGDLLIFALPTALSLCIRKFILSWYANKDALKALTIALAQEQAEQVLNHTLSHLDAIPLAESPQVRFGPLISAIGTFDIGKYVNIVFLPEDLVACHNKGLMNIREIQECHWEKTKGSASELAKDLATGDPDYSGGLTLFVTGGIGRATTVDYPRIMQDKWHTLVLGIADFTLLAWDPDITLLKIWKILQQKVILKENNIRIQNVNGFLNLLGYWRKQSYGIWPSDFPVDKEKEGFIVLQTDFITEVRAHARRSYDEHIIAFNENIAYRMKREKQRSLFKEQENQPAYVNFDVSRLMGAVESQARPWWVYIKNDEIPSVHRSLVFQLWQAVFYWMIKAVPILEEAFSKLPSGPIRISIHFDQLDSWPELVLSEIQNSETTSIYAFNGPDITLSLGMGFLQKFNVAENIAERTLVEHIIEALIRITGEHQEPQTILEKIFPNKDARYFHILEATHYNDHFKLIGDWDETLIPPEDDANSELGLAWLVRQPQKTGELIVGYSECTAFLQNLTSSLWARLKQKLEQISFSSLAEMSFHNLISLDMDEALWKRTARANLSVNSNKEEVLTAVYELGAKRNSSSLASRLLIEMGICVCPKPHHTGKTISQSDFEALLADAILLANLGQYCDAIFDEYMPAQIQISPSGSLKLEPDFYDKVVLPRFRNFSNRDFKTSAERYDDFFIQDDVESNVIEKFFNTEYRNAFKAEYGVSLEHLLKFQEAIQTYGLKIQEAFFELSADTMNTITPDIITAEDIRAIIESFALPIRKRWDESKPLGKFRKQDWYPWKFRRRLSLTSRPIITLDRDGKTTYLISPGLFDKTLTYIIHNSFNGYFSPDHFSSQEMRSLTGRITAERGHAFNQQVAARLRELGLQATSDLQVTQLGGEKLLGDFDVLAWNNKRNIVYILECKNFNYAKIMDEIVEQLNRFKGKTDENGNLDELAKHLRRVEWVENNKASISAFTYIPLDSLRVEHFLVFSNEVPMKYADDLPIETNRILVFDDFTNLLNS